MKYAMLVAIITALIMTVGIGGYVGYKLYQNKGEKVEVAEFEVTAAALESTPPQFVSFMDDLKTYDESQELIRDIKEFLGESASNNGVYIKNLSTGQEWGLNQDQDFAPASISKVPYGILTLKYIDEGKLSMDDRLTLQQRHKSYTTDPLYNYANGSTWAVRDLLRLLLVDSDNVPMNMLEEYFGGPESFLQQIEELGIKDFSRRPHRATPQAIGDTFEKIYHGELLSPESNQIMIDHLSKYKVFSGDRIRLGVDRAAGRNIEVVHKIGNLTGVYHDAGYIKSPGGDFILVTLNKNTSPGTGVAQITGITQIAYEFFNQ